MGSQRLTKAQFQKRLRSAQARLTDRLLAQSSDNKRFGIYGAGLSTEGRFGGYQEALRDVEAVLNHGFPEDPFKVWGKDNG